MSDRCHGTRRVLERRDDPRGAEFNRQPDSTAGGGLRPCGGCPDCQRGGDDYIVLGLTVDADTRAWMLERPDEVECVKRFVALMMRELAANREKGDRPGWLTMTPSQAVAELLYHVGKLSIAVREVGSGKPPDSRTSGFTADDCIEYGADVANCALMALDVMDLFGVPR